MRVFALILVAALALSQTPAERKPDRTISVGAERFTFTPSKINVQQGEFVELVITSDDVVHGFRLVGTNINVVVPPPGGGEARVRILARDPGRFTFECSEICGAGHNLMRGEIVVKENKK